MSSVQTKSSINPNPHFDGKQWVIHISRTLEQELDETESPISIFNVPKSLMDIYPNSYIPQQVAIGPIHSARPELRNMERYKLAAAKRNQKDFQALKIHDLAHVLVEFEPKIRDNYQTLLELSGETLAWMMVLDASFLLEFLQVCAVKKNKATSNVISSRLSRLATLGRNKAGYNAILRDVSLVDNQIPLFVLRKLLELYFASSDKADDMLFSMLVGICEELSPFKMVEDSTCNNVEVKTFDHLLHFLYHFVVPNLEDATGLDQEEVIAVDNANEENQEIPTNEDKDAYQRVKSILSHLYGPVTLVKKVIFSKPVKVIVKLPWAILSKLPMMKVIKEPLENFFGSLNEDEESKDDETATNPHASPLLEEIEIPSVTQLADAGVTFQPTSQGISSISFDCKARILYLPTINLDVNSTIVLRNLVAYEVCSALGPLTLSRYTDLMNGIIDTGEDAKYLRERGIVVNRLKSDEEVANLWNGMSKSIRLTKVPFLDKVIEDVNKDYSMRWKVKLKKYVRSYVYGSWRILTLFGAMLMVVFMGLQAFCSVYNCARIVPIENLGL